MNYRFRMMSGRLQWRDAGVYFVVATMALLASTIFTRPYPFMPIFYLGFSGLFVLVSTAIITIKLFAFINKMGEALRKRG